MNSFLKILLIIIIILLICSSCWVFGAKNALNTSVESGKVELVTKASPILGMCPKNWKLYKFDNGKYCVDPDFEPVKSKVGNEIIGVKLKGW